MGHRINPILARLPQLSIWSSLWYSKLNYYSLFYQDLFIKSYLKVELRRYGLILADCFIKRTYNSLFIDVFIINFNNRPNQQFKPFLYPRTSSFTKAVLKAESARWTFCLSQLSPNSLVKLFFRVLKFYKNNLRFIAVTANPILLGEYFIRRHKAMNSSKYILRSFKTIYKVISEKETLLEGLSTKVAGPIKAPRMRRALTLKNVFFGTTPLQTLSNFIFCYSLARVHSEGVVSIKFTVFKRIVESRLLKVAVLIDSLKNISDSADYMFTFPFLTKDQIYYWRRYDKYFIKARFRRFDKTAKQKTLYFQPKKKISYN